MLDRADESGHVTLNDSLYAVEQRLGVDECLDAYSWLEVIKVVRRTGDGWTIPAMAEHSGPVGATADSLAVLRRHLDKVGQPDLQLVPALAVAEEPEETPVGVIALRRWRRAVPIAAGVAASVAALTGATQLIPQAASNARDVALRADAPTTHVSAGPIAAAVTTVTNAVNATTGKTTPTIAAAPTLTTSPPIAGTLTSIVCAVPQILATVTDVALVQLPLTFDEHGKPLWAAVVTGTVANNTADTLVLQGLSVVAHVVGGDTAPVQALLTTPLLTPNTVAPFSAVVALGSVRPSEAVTATAQPTGSKSSC